MVDQRNSASSVLHFVAQRRQAKAEHARNAHLNDLEVPVPPTRLSREPSQASTKQRHNTIRPEEIPRYRGPISGHPDAFDTDVEDLNGTSIISSTAISPTEQNQELQPLPIQVERGTKQRRHSDSTETDEIVHSLVEDDVQRIGDFPLAKPHLALEQSRLGAIQHRGSVIALSQAARDSHRNYEGQGIASPRQSTADPLERTDHFYMSSSDLNDMAHQAQLGRLSSQLPYDLTAMHRGGPDLRLNSTAEQCPQGGRVTGFQQRYASNSAMAKQGLFDRKHSMSTTQGLENVYPSSSKNAEYAAEAYGQTNEHQNEHVSRFEADTDPERTEHEGQFDQSQPYTHLDQSRKRVRSLDYHPKKLAHMKYQELKEESFDHDPRTHSQELPAKLVNGSAQEKLDHLYSWRKDDKKGNQGKAFFASLGIDEHEECGDLIVERFRLVLENFKTIRKDKRKVCRDFENEVEQRQLLLEKKGMAIQGDLRTMQAKGKDIVPKTASRISKQSTEG